MARINKLSYAQFKTIAKLMHAKRNEKTMLCLEQLYVVEGLDKKTEFIESLEDWKLRKYVLNACDAFDKAFLIAAEFLNARSLDDRLKIAIRAYKKETTTDSLEILILSYIEGLSQSEVSERTGVNQSTVSREIKRYIEIEQIMAEIAYLFK
ncbi:sigma factor-like helix-turn-helix DNA-binding protein [Vibrio mediterranei]|uniref:sigma factor-like helix-turn-helix DNA-binding protein n=1 Tax=Vibrio mediterranei TaxID=689 RepID=UPI0038CE9273